MSVLWAKTFNSGSPEKGQQEVGNMFVVCVETIDSRLCGDGSAPYEQMSTLFLPSSDKNFVKSSQEVSDTVSSLNQILFNNF